MNLDYVCNQMIRILHCNICYINMAGQIEMYFGDGADGMNPVFTDAIFREKIIRREDKNYPDIFHEKNCIFYAVFSMEQGKLVVGPVCAERPNQELTDYMVKTHHISENAGFRLTYCEIKIFGSSVLMLYHLLTGEEMSLHELWSKNELNYLDIEEAMASVSQVIFQRQEYEIPHNPYEQEVRELESVRRGDIKMLKRSLEETYRGEVGRLAKSEVRQAKNIAICVITLASRAAIEGGMLPEEAFSMVDGYILKIEEMNSIVKIDAMMRQAEYDYAKIVSGIQEKKQRNELIERTKNYIFQNLHSEIIISKIAYEIGVNASYLSDLFHRVEGVTIQKYIQREKVHLAENMLRYSDYAVKDIANHLSFCTQSYFGSVFKSQIGMSPVQYRKKFEKFTKNKNS